jgi:hypothetical protein
MEYVTALMLPESGGGGRVLGGGGVNGLHFFCIKESCTPDVNYLKKLVFLKFQTILHSQYHASLLTLLKLLRFLKT